MYHSLSAVTAETALLAELVASLSVLALVEVVSVGVLAGGGRGTGVLSLTERGGLAVTFAVSISVRCGPTLVISEGTLVLESS